MSGIYQPAYEKVFNVALNVAQNNFSRIEAAVSY